MLSLSRRPGESIIIGNEISIKVHSVNGNRVKLAIAAPLHVAIRRSELLIDSTEVVPIADQLDAREHGFRELAASAS